MSHALLSPSAASRWLECTPAPRFEAQFPDSSGDAAKEGSLAHEIGEYLVNKRELPVDYDGLMLDPKWSQSPYLCEDMLEHAANYAQFVLTAYDIAKQQTPDAILKIEEQIDLRDFIPEGFGTGDAIIIADGVLEIIDLKYGKGVRVDAANNKQMMVYALGAYLDMSDLYDINEVRMTIFQPRLDNISSHTMTVEDLLKWKDETLVPRAKMAFAGEGDFKAGSHCKFCRGRNKCKTLADYNLEIAKYEFRKAEQLNADDIADILTRADMFKSWINGIEEHALKEAIERGVRWPGYKLVEGRSVRKYSDNEAVAKTLTDAGIEEPIIYERKLLGITAMEKAITKKRFNELLSELVIKPAGKPTLVPESDKRAEFNSAAQDFANI